MAHNESSAETGSGRAGHPLDGNALRTTARPLSLRAREEKMNLTHERLKARIAILKTALPSVERDTLIKVYERQLAEAVPR